MIIIAVMYTFPEDRADEAEGMLRELAVASRAEPGCAGYEVMRGSGADRSAFVLFEAWRDQTAIDTHQAAEHFIRLGLNGIRTFMTGRQAVVGNLID